MIGGSEQNRLTKIILRTKCFRVAGVFKRIAGAIFNNDMIDEESWYGNNSYYSSDFSFYDKQDSLYAANNLTLSYYTSYYNQYSIEPSRYSGWFNNSISSW